MSVRPPSLLRSLAGRVRRLFVARTPCRTVPPRLRGKLRRAVVVPTPDPMFSEAVFILRDEKLRDPGPPCGLPFYLRRPSFSTSAR